MADPPAIARSIDEAASVGIKVALALSSLAETVKTGSRRLQGLSDDVYATCSLLNQVKTLLRTDGSAIGFNRVFSRDVSCTVKQCLDAFRTLEKDLHRANEQIAAKPTGSGKIVLSTPEQTRWPFLQAGADSVRSDLKSSKTNLHLILMTATLALAIKLTSTQQPSSLSLEEERQLKAAVLSLRREATLLQTQTASTTPERREEDRTASSRLDRLRVRSNSQLRHHQQQQQQKHSGAGRRAKRMVSFPQLRPQTSQSEGAVVRANGLAPPMVPQASVSGTPGSKPPTSIAQSSPSSQQHSSGNRSVAFETTQGQPEVPAVAFPPAPLVPDAPVSSRSNAGEPETNPETNMTPGPGKQKGAFFPNIWKSIRPSRSKTPKNNTVPAVPEISTTASQNVNHQAIPTPPVSPSLLQAWTFVATPLSSTSAQNSDSFSGLHIQILPLPLLPNEISKLLSTGRQASNLNAPNVAVSILTDLDALNQRQRQMILSHARYQGLRLLSVQRRAKQHIETAFGSVQVEVLVWFTARDRNVNPNGSNGSQYYSYTTPQTFPQTQPIYSTAPTQPIPQQQPIPNPNTTYTQPALRPPWEPYRSFPPPQAQAQTQPYTAHSRTHSQTHPSTPPQPQPSRASQQQQQQQAQQPTNIPGPSAATVFTTRPAGTSAYATYPAYTQPQTQPTYTYTTAYNPYTTTYTSYKPTLGPSVLYGPGPAFATNPPSSSADSLVDDSPLAAERQRRRAVEQSGAWGGGVAGSAPPPAPGLAGLKHQGSDVEYEAEAGEDDGGGGDGEGDGDGDGDYDDSGDEAVAELLNRWTTVLEEGEEMQRATELAEGAGRGQQEGVGTATATTETSERVVQTTRGSPVGVS